MRGTVKKFMVVAIWLIADAAFGAPEDALKCPKIDNDIERLTCFDNAFKATVVDNSSSKIVTQWEVKEDISPVDDKKSIFASITASTVTSSFVVKPDAFLVLRCSEGSTAFFVASNVYFSEVSDVTVRVDASPAEVQTQMWSVSTTGNAVGLWGGQNPVALARSLKDNGKFAIRIQGRYSFEASFDLGTIEPIKQRVGDLCNWKYL